ncbi:MAG TPA: hypothetical protein VGC10_06155 [Sphingomonas sp.]
MKIHGTMTSNLEEAIRSAERLRDHPVYSDTLAYWQDLLREARRRRMDEPENKRATLDVLIVRLENELAIRARAARA